MKCISLWAFHHKWVARMSLIIIYLLLNVTGIFLGEAISIEGLKIPLFLPYLLSIPFFIALINYPSRKEKDKTKNYYRRQKTIDGILAFISFVLIVFTSNYLSSSPSHLPVQSTSVHAAEPISIRPVKPFERLKLETKKFAFIIKHWKALKHNYRLLRKAYKDSDNTSKVLLIILASLVAAALLLLVMSLSCSLSCSGAEGAALLVLLLGTGLIVFLLVKVIGSINRGPKKKVKPATI